MSLRRAIGSAVMLAGAASLMGVAAAATLSICAEVHAGFDLNRFAASLAWLGAALAGGVALMAGGRAVYGQWRKAAPIANVTGDIAQTVGVLCMLVLGGLMILVLAVDFQPDDIPAAVALGVGAAAGLLLAQFGVRLRATERRYPDAQS